MLLPLLLLSALILTSGAAPYVLSGKNKIEGFSLQDLQFLISLGVVGGFSRVIFGVFTTKPWWWLEVLRDFFKGLLMAALLVAAAVLAGKTEIWLLIIVTIFSGIEPQAALDTVKTVFKTLMDTILRLGAGGGKS